MSQQLPGGISQILPNLFLGNIGAAKSKKLLEQHNIKYILRVLKIKDWIYEGEFAYHIVEIEDHDDIEIMHHFNDAVEFIQQKMDLEDGNVFVHCQQGKSRSASFVIAYLINKHGMSLKDALAYVKERRPVAHPNPGFIEQLEKYEKQLRSTTSNL
jgi:protein phosphatase slingshot